MTAYLIALGQVHDFKRFEQYIEGVMPTLEPYSAEIISVADPADVLEGDAPFPRVALVKFPSKQDAINWKNDPVYEAAAEHRRASSDFVFYLVDDSPSE